MSQLTAFDGLLGQIWQQAISGLRERLREEPLPSLSSARVVSILLKVGLSPREPEIRDCLALLEDWVKQLRVGGNPLDESSTGLLGLWIHLRHRQRKRVDSHLESLFLRSVEHNLRKPKDLSLASSADLLGAVAVGLRDTSPTTELQVRVGECLQALVKNADALALVQLLQSWELIQRKASIAYMDIQRKLEAIAADVSVPIAERAVAYYGQIHIGKVSGMRSLEHEWRLLDCLGMAASSGQGEGASMVKMYVLCLPFLREKMSFDSLFDAWKTYNESSFKRAKAENYWARCLFAVFLAILAWVACRPWFRQLDSGFQASIGTAAATRY
jgi:hypothetical protein